MSITTPRSERFEYLQTAKFLVVGGLVFGVDVTGVWIFHWIMHPLLAVSLAYVLAVMAHFSLNRQWVFDGKNGNLRRQVLRYLSTSGVCWLATVALVEFELRTITHNVMVAKALAIPPVTLIGFSLLKRFVFSPRQA